MLFKAHPLKLLVGLSFSLVSLYGLAQSVELPKDAPVFNNPYFEDTEANRKALEEGMTLGKGMVRDILSSYQTLQTTEDQNVAQQAKRRADDIADASMAKDRDKVLEFLGISPQADTALYYFVSWSMPKELLRAYAIDAMWSGGTLVFKGVPLGKQLGKFIVNDLRELVYGKGAAANLSIDPRLFDAYAISTVPSIVFTTVRGNMQCQGVTPVVVKANGTQGVYDKCPELDPSSYWKVGGAVTTNYALESFIDDGATLAKPYLASLAKGWRDGTAPGKEQKAFTGDWKDAISPSEMLAAQEAAGLLTKPSKAIEGAGN